MNRRLAAAWIGAALVVGIAAAVWLLRNRPGAHPSDGEDLAAGAPESDAALAAPAQLERQRITLWMPGGGGRVAAWTVDVEMPPGDPAKRARAILEALLAARPDDGSRAAPLFDDTVELAHSLLASDGVLYVDLRRPDGGPPPGAGSMLETERLYSIVQSVTDNEPSVTRVVLLWNGEQRLSFTGHFDTSRPIAPRPDLELR